ncbi:MAG: SusF/SusE family outer membrane protein [Prevotella sp.]|nr:SusF/SusE family outer membrane protein [Prevotella sp.]
MKKLLTLFAMSLFAVTMSAQRWIQLIENSDLEGTENKNFVTKEAGGEFAGQVINSIITDGVGVDGSRGIQVVSPAGAVNDWDTQFWIVFDEPLVEGDRISVSFDYKASQDATADTQSHGNPGDYQHWAAIGSPNFTTEWQTYEKTVTVDASMATGNGGNGLKSIAFNLSKVRDADVTYYFDNIYVALEVPKEIEWLNLVINGDSEADADFGFIKVDQWRDTENGPGKIDNVFSFVGREVGKYDNPCIENGVGVNYTRGVAVHSVADATYGWDTQFFITTTHKFQEGEHVKIKFDYRSDDPATVSSQWHALPGDYIDYRGPGLSGWSGNEIGFTPEWQTFEKEVIVSAEASGGGTAQTIAFNLNENTELATTFYFDNIEMSIDKDMATDEDWALAEKIAAGPPAPEATWTVAGNFLSNQWKPEDEANDMTLEDGVYKLVKTEVTLEKGVSYELKVAKDHAWDEAYPEENYTFSVEETAIYTVTVTFNAETKEIVVTTEKTGDVEVLPEATWTVAGNFVGSSWNPEDAANDMASEDGLYKLVKTDVTLEKGVTYEFKVAKNHAWTEAYPSSNYTFTVEETAIYTVTVTFNPETQEITVTTVKTGDAQGVEHAYSVMGTFGGDSWSIDNDMTKGEDGLYTVTFENVAAGNYEFKVRVDHDWSVSYPESNYQLAVEQDGSTVTITFNEETKEITATATSSQAPPVIEVWTVAGNFVGSSWNPEDAANDLTSTDGVIYTLTKEEVTLEKGVTYEFKVAKDHAWTEAYPENNYTFTVEETAIYTVTVTFNAETKEIAVTTVKTGDAQAVEHTYSVIGTLKGDSWSVDNDMTKGEDGIYTLTIEDVAAGNYEFKVRVDHDWSVSYPGSNYQVTVDQDGSKVVISFNEETKEVNATVTAPTGISYLNAEATQGAIYNLSGQKVGASYKGIVIVNGKKVLMK